MKTFAMNRRAWMIMMAATLVAPLGLVSQSTARGADKDDPPIVKFMEEINGAYKLLRRTARRKNFDEESQKQVSTMIEYSKKAHDAKVPMIEKMPEAKREAAYKEFKALLEKQIKTLGEILAAIKGGDNDKAAQLIDDLGGIKKDGHDKFVPA